jgi:hypothetical protein
MAQDAMRHSFPPRPLISSQLLRCPTHSFPGVAPEKLTMCLVDHLPLGRPRSWSLHSPTPGRYIVDKHVSEAPKPPIPPAWIRYLLPTIVSSPYGVESRCPARPYAIVLASRFEARSRNGLVEEF